MKVQLSSTKKDKAKIKAEATVKRDPSSLALAHLATGMIGPELLDLNYWTMNYWP